MVLIGVSITKSTPFRNGTQEFSNDYYYEMVDYPTASAADTIIDNIVALEKTFHATVVTFVRGRLWKQTGSTATSEMISQKNLSGTGARTANLSLDKERAFLFRCRAGVDSRGNPVYLRKWYHSCGEFVSGQTIPAGVLQQTSGWTTAERALQEAAMSAIGTANGSTNVLGIRSKVGRVPAAVGAWSAHQFLEHHQFGDMWRAQ